MGSAILAAVVALVTGQYDPQPPPRFPKPLPPGQPKAQPANPPKVQPKTQPEAPPKSQPESPPTDQPKPEPEVQPKASPTGQPTDSATRYFEIPLKGEVGKEITAPGVREAFKAAASSRATCIVFVIQTDGGKVVDAEAIALLMDKDREKFKYYAIVNKAISAAVWPLSRMDGIFFAPGSTAGAAVAYSVSTRTGQAEVDAKFNAAVTAKVAAAAELRGQPGCVYRAMMLQDATLYRWKDDGGKWTLGEQAPPGVKDALKLDGPSSVLAWTAEQAAESGFGKVIKSADAATLGELVGADEWVSVGTGTTHMARAHRDVERLAKEVEKAGNEITESRQAIVDIAKTLSSQITRATAADPRLVPVYYTEYGMLTPDSQIKWRQQSDRAINAWSGVLALVSDLKQAERRAAGAVDDYNKAVAKELSGRLLDIKPEPIKLEPVTTNVDLKEIQRDASDILARIRSERGKTRV